MYYVYVLVDEDSDRNYVGYSANLSARIAQHRDGKGAKFTKHGNWQLVYYEAFASQEDAMTREKNLKHNGNARHQ